jgi:hypothetical protein
MLHFFGGSGVSRVLLKGAFALAVLGIPAQALHAVSCSVTKHGSPSDADKALLAGDYAKAEDLYKAALAKQAADVDATVGLVHALLRQQKVEDASEAVKSALEAAPKTAAFITLRGEIEYRQGELWLVEPTVVESYKIDPCNARTRLLFARIAEATSRHAIARQQAVLAHQFDPEDAEIRQEWIRTLPIAQRVQELESFLSAPNGLDQASQLQLRADLERLKAESAAPARSCRLASGSASAEFPFIRLAGWNGHARAYGLEVGLNGAPTRLQLDTRGAGITVYRPAADHAVLKRLGDEVKAGAPGAKPNYTAIADSVKIGGLEFKDCLVNVIDSSSPFDDGAGSVGIDIFSDFLVTVDFPMRKLGIAPLPARPGDTATPSLHSLAADFDPLAPIDEPAKPAGPPAAGAAQAPAPAAVGPFDRILPPEMKDYTQIYRAGHDLILPTSLGGDKIKLFVPDASIQETNMSTSVALDLPKVREDKTKEAAAPGGKAAKVFVADDVSFNFAHVAQKLNGVSTADTSFASAADGVAISGFLGMDTTLIRLTLRIDYRDGLLKAEYVPGRGSDKLE